MTVSIWGYLIGCILAFIAGALTGLTLMCLVEIHKDDSKTNEEEDDKDVLSEM